MDIPCIQIQNMSASEMLQHIPPEKLEEIKRHDPNPVFEAYKVAHPGESSTYIVGLGTKILRWFGGILKKIKDKIAPGTPVFYLHGKTNSHKGRDKIGEIVATIQNFASEVISIVYRFKDYMHLRTDIASFEAPLQIQGGTGLEGHEVQPHELGDITGLALADSATATPAFAGAIKTAYLQCLKKEENMPDINLEDVISFINEKKISPTQLFDNDAIMSVDAVQEALAKKRGNENLYHENARLKAQLATMREKTENEKASLESKVKELSVEVNTSKLSKAFADEIKKREKLTQKQREYLVDNQDKLQAEDGVELSVTLNKFIDSGLQEFEKWEALFKADNKERKEQEIQEKKPVRIADNEFIPAF